MAFLSNAIGCSSVARFHGNLQSETDTNIDVKSHHI